MVFETQAPIRTRLILKHSLFLCIYGLNRCRRVAVRAKDIVLPNLFSPESHAEWDMHLKDVVDITYWSEIENLKNLFFHITFHSTA